METKAQSLKFRTAFTLVEFLVAASIVGVVVGIALPAIQAVRASAHRIACSNNVRQLALGIENYESVNHQLPIGVREASDAKFPLQTWLAQILPFVEQSNLYDESVEAYLSGVSPFDHSQSQAAIPIYGCPSDGRSGEPQWTHGGLLVALTSYVGVCGISRDEPNGTICYGQRIRWIDVADGLSSTLLIGERPGSPDNWYGWWYVGAGQDKTGNPEMIMGVCETNLQTNYAEHCPIGPYHFAPGSFDEMCDVFHFWSPHPGGANFAFCDGSVKFLSYNADSVLPAMASRAGREVVSE